MSRLASKDEFFAPEICSSTTSDKYLPPTPFFSLLVFNPFYISLEQIANFKILTTLITVGSKSPSATWIRSLLNSMLNPVGNSYGADGICSTVLKRRGGENVQSFLLAWGTKRLKRPLLQLHIWSICLIVTAFKN